MIVYRPAPNWPMGAIYQAPPGGGNPFYGALARREMYQPFGRTIRQLDANQIGKAQSYNSRSAGAGNFAVLSHYSGPGDEQLVRDVWQFQMDHEDAGGVDGMLGPNTIASMKAIPAGDPLRQVIDTRLRLGAAPRPPPGPAPGPSPVPPPGPGPGPGPAPGPNGGKKKKVLIIGGVVVAVAALGAGAWYFMKK